MKINRLRIAFLRENLSVFFFALSGMDGGLARHARSLGAKLVFGGSRGVVIKVVLGGW